MFGKRRSGGSATTFGRRRGQAEDASPGPESLAAIAGVAIDEAFENQEWDSKLKTFFPAKKRPQWSDRGGKIFRSRESVHLPSVNWRWDQDWAVDKHFTDAEGWEYASRWERMGAAGRPTKSERKKGVRRRRWVRRRVRVNNEHGATADHPLRLAKGELSDVRAASHNSGQRPAAAAGAASGSMKPSVGGAGRERDVVNPLQGLESGLEEPSTEARWSLSSRRDRGITGASDDTISCQPSSSASDLTAVEREGAGRATADEDTGPGAADTVARVGPAKRGVGTEPDGGGTEAPPSVDAEPQGDEVEGGAVTMEQPASVSGAADVTCAEAADAAPDAASTAHEPAVGERGMPSCDVSEGGAESGEGEGVSRTDGPGRLGGAEEPGEKQVVESGESREAQCTGSQQNAPLATHAEAPAEVPAAGGRDEAGGAAQAATAGSAGGEGEDRGRGQATAGGTGAGVPRPTVAGASRVSDLVRRWEGSEALRSPARQSSGVSVPSRAPAAAHKAAWAVQNESGVEGGSAGYAAEVVCASSSEEDGGGTVAGRGDTGAPDSATAASARPAGVCAVGTTGENEEGEDEEDVEDEEEGTQEEMDSNVEFVAWHVFSDAGTGVGDSSAEEPAAVAVVPSEPPPTSPPRATPGDGAPGNNTPGDDAPGNNTPGDGAPGNNTPGDGAPGNNTPGNGAPGEGAPGEDSSGEDTSDDETPPLRPLGGEDVRLSEGEGLASVPEDRGPSAADDQGTSAAQPRPRTSSEDLLAPEVTELLLDSFDVRVFPGRIPSCDFCGTPCSQGHSAFGLVRFGGRFIAHEMCARRACAALVSTAEGDDQFTRILHFESLRGPVTRWLRGGSVSVTVNQAVLPSLAISKRFRGRDITVRASVWPWLEQSEETEAAMCSRQGHATWQGVHRRFLALDVPSCAQDTQPVLALEIFKVPRSSRKPPKCIARGVLPLLALHGAVGSKVTGWLVLTGGVGIDSRGTAALRCQSTPPIASDAINIALELSVAKQSVPMRAPASARALAMLPLTEPLLVAATARLHRRGQRSPATDATARKDATQANDSGGEEEEEVEEDPPVGTLWLHVQGAQLRQDSVRARVRLLCSVDGVRAASGESHGSLRPAFDYRCAFAVPDVRSQLTVSLVDPKAGGAAAAAATATSSPGSPAGPGAPEEEEHPGMVGTVDIGVADIEYHSQQAALASVGMAAVAPQPLHVPVFAPGKRGRDPVATVTLLAVFERNGAAIASSKPVEFRRPVEEFAVKAFRLHASRLAALLRLVVSTAHGYNDVVRWRAGYLSPACFVAYHALVYCLPFDRVLAVLPLLLIFLLVALYRDRVTGQYTRRLLASRADAEQLIEGATRLRIALVEAEGLQSLPDDAAAPAPALVPEGRRRAGSSSSGGSDAATQPPSPYFSVVFRSPMDATLPTGARWLGRTGVIFDTASPVFSPNARVVTEGLSLYKRLERYVLSKPYGGEDTDLHTWPMPGVERRRLRAVDAFVTRIAHPRKGVCFAPSAASLGAGRGGAHTGMRAVMRPPWSRESSDSSEDEQQQGGALDVASVGQRGLSLAPSVSEASFGVEVLREPTSALAHPDDDVALSDSKDWTAGSLTTQGASEAATARFSLSRLAVDAATALLTPVRQGTAAWAGDGLAAGDAGEEVPDLPGLDDGEGEREAVSWEESGADLLLELRTVGDTRVHGRASIPLHEAVETLGDCDAQTELDVWLPLSEDGEGAWEAHVPASAESCNAAVRGAKRQNDPRWAMPRRRGLGRVRVRVQIIEPKEEITSADVEGGGASSSSSTGTVMERFRRVRTVAAELQNGIQYFCDVAERVIHALNWTSLATTQLVLRLALAALVVCLVVPTRWLLLAFGLSQFTKVLRQPGGMHFRAINLLLSLPTRPELQEVVIRRKYWKRLVAPPRRPPPDALVSGYLRKLGRRRWTWKRRFFMLSRTHASLTYWQDEAAYAAGAVPLGSILVTSSKAAIEEGPLTELLCRGSAGPTSDAERTLNTALRRMTYALNQRAREAGERGAGGAAQEGEAEEDSLARWLAADGASATFEERVEALGCGANRTLFMRVTGARLKRRTGAESYSTRTLVLAFDSGSEYREWRDALRGCIPQSGARPEALRGDSRTQVAGLDASASSMQRQLGSKGLSRVDSTASQGREKGTAAQPAAQRIRRLSALASSTGDQRWWEASQPRQRRGSVIQTLRRIVSREGGAQDR